MAKKIQDEEGNTYVQVKPWYKKWWIWVLAIIVLFFAFGLAGGNKKNSNSSTSNNPSKASGHQTTNSEKSAESSTTSKKVTVNYQDYSYSKAKTYTTNYSDTSWSAATLSVSKVVLYTLNTPTTYKSANDGTFKAQGFVRLYFSVKANRDVSVYPTQGTYIFNGSEQHASDSGESWDGDISNGVTKTGAVTVPIKDASNLKSIRAKIDANYTTNDYDDNNSNHTFDFTLNL